MAAIHVVMASVTWRIQAISVAVAKYFLTHPMPMSFGESERK